MNATTPRRWADFSSLRRPEARLLILLMLVVDATLIVMHLSHALFARPDAWTFDLGADRSYGEFVIYLKLLTVALCCLAVARGRRSAVFAALAAVSLVYLAEDALLLHERVGWALQGRVEQLLPSLSGVGIMSVQLGELLWFGLLAVRASEPARREEGAV